MKIMLKPSILWAYLNNFTEELRLSLQKNYITHQTVNKLMKIPIRFFFSPHKSLFISSKPQFWHSSLKFFQNLFLLQSFSSIFYLDSLYQNHAILIIVTLKYVLKLSHINL